MDKPKIICLTPVKNEAWILERFLTSTSLWADYIIIADQNSNDGSIEIIKKFPKVILVSNPDKNFNESERQKILINEARKIPCDKILIALDADESLTANSINNNEWSIIRNLSKGTVIKFDWVNLLPDENKYWFSKDKMPFGFIDDGSEHVGRFIHSPRIPVRKNSPIYYPKDIKVMHFQYADWGRMKSKHRWYQCIERIKFPKRSIVDIYRQYHHMDSIQKNSFKGIPDLWLNFYLKNNIDYLNFKKERFYYWDLEIINLFKIYGPEYFSRIDVWDFDWDSFNIKNNSGIIFKERKYLDVYILNFLKKTQYINNKFILKIIDIFLKIFIKIKK